ncbi:MAG: hypothetical protein V1792_15285 [Pseudomonadota bacterium]
MVNCIASFLHIPSNPTGEMHESTNTSFLKALTACLVVPFVIGACSTETPKVKDKSEPERLAGTWILNSRIADGKEVPASERVIKLFLRTDGTFSVDFRGEARQPWIRAGQGGFSYDPPMLRFFWDNGASVTFLVTETESDRMKLHRGWNLVPLKEQEPEEVFVRHRVEKGPSKKPS